MKYYEVIAKCGHVGKRKYIDISFAVRAESGRDAAQKVLNYSKVKKQLKDAISNVIEIDYEGYIELRKRNSEDIYLRSHYKKERDLSTYEILELECNNLKRKIEFTTRKEMINYKLKKAKILLEAYNYEYVY